jgi:17beta-estradiol 17-dehydrogenase / very-long-chain 3-oxoacyl-CoA reductase
MSHQLSKIRRASVTIPSPKAFAAAAVRCIGYERTTSPYWSHKLQLWVMETLPFVLVNKITYGMHAGLRAKAMKKANKST